MPSYHDGLAGDAVRLVAIEALIEDLKSRGPGKLAHLYFVGDCLGEETGLSVECWRKMADRYLAHGLADLEQELTIIFRDYQLVGDVESDRRSGYGRAIPKATVVELWSAFWPRSEVEAVVKNLPFLSAKEARDTIEAVPLGRYIMWSTYCEHHADCDPFDPRAPNHQLIDDLGLKFSTGEVFYLFWYGIPSGVELRIPTVADAYSGGYFFPFKPGGRTFPIRYPDKLTGRPERVHRPINGDRLLETIEAILLPAV